MFLASNPIAGEQSFILTLARYTDFREKQDFQLT